MCLIYSWEFPNKLHNTTSCYTIISVKRTSNLKLCPIRKCCCTGKIQIYVVHKYSHLYTPHSAVCHSMIPEIGNSSSQISSISLCTLMSCYSDSSTTNPYCTSWDWEWTLSSLKLIMSLKRGNLPGLQPKYPSAALQNPFAVPVGWCFWEWETRITATTNSLLPHFP